MSKCEIPLAPQSSGSCLILLISIKQVSKYFDQIITKSPLLVYLTELAKCGYVVGPTSRLDLAGCLSSLRSIQRTWEAPQPKVLSRMELVFPDIGHPNNIAWWEVKSGAAFRRTEIFANGGKSNQLDFIHICDIIHGKSTPSHPTTIKLDFDCSEYYLDIEGQLLIAIEDSIFGECQAS